MPRQRKQKLADASASEEEVSASEEEVAVEGEEEAEATEEEVEAPVEDDEATTEEVETSAEEVEAVEDEPMESVEEEAPATEEKTNEIVKGKIIKSTQAGQPDLNLQPTSMRMMQDYCKKKDDLSVEWVVSANDKTMNFFYAAHSITCDVAEFAPDQRNTNGVLASAWATDADDQCVGAKDYRGAKLSCAHQMLLKLGYDVPETETPGKYLSFDFNARKTVSTANALINSNPDEPVLRLFNDPMSILMSHARPKNIEHKYEVVKSEEEPSKTSLKLTYGDKEKSCEVKTFNDKNLRLYDAYMEITDEMLREIGYPVSIYRPLGRRIVYICTLKSSVESEPDLTYYKGYTFYNLLEQNMRMTTRMQTKEGPHVIERLDDEDESRWLHLTYAGHHVEELIRKKEDPMVLRNIQLAKLVCSKKILELLGYDFSGVSEHELENMLVTTWKQDTGVELKRADADPKNKYFKCINNKQPDLFHKEGKEHEYKHFLHIHFKSSLYEKPEFTKKPDGTIHLQYGQVKTQYLPIMPHPSLEPGFFDIKFCEERLARRVLIGLGYRFDAWPAEERFNSASKGMRGGRGGRGGPPMRGMRGGPPMRGGPMRGGPMRGGPMRGGPPRGRGGLRGGPVGGPRGGPQGKRPIQDSPYARGGKRPAYGGEGYDGGYGGGYGGGYEGYGYGGGYAGGYGQGYGGGYGY